MDRKPQRGTRRCAGRFQHVEQGQELIDVVEEGPLPFACLRSAKTGMGIEHRDMGEADPGRLRRPQDAQRGLGHIGIASAADCMVKIVEFDDMAETALQ